MIAACDRCNEGMPYPTGVRYYPRIAPPQPMGLPDLRRPAPFSAQRRGPDRTNRGCQEAAVIAAAATHAISWRVSTSPGANVEWGSPPAIYMALDQEFDFTLDAAAGALNAKHIRYVQKDTDALRISWAGERVFCNPPYGRGLGSWVRKALLEASEHGALVVMLLPARTDVSWFHEVVLPHAEIRFIRGRLSYTLGAPARSGRSPFASMVVVFHPGAKWNGPERAQLLFPFLPKTVALAGKET
jgi:phage N-6-adenine-methyltransferase